MSLCLCCARSEKFGRHVHRPARYTPGGVAAKCHEHPEAVVLDAAERCRNADPNRVYGFDITYVTVDGRELTCHYVTDSEQTARRKAMLRTHAREVTNLRPLTEAQYVKAFGRGRT